MTRAAAFFDLDKTVIAKSSTLAFGRPFFQGGLINRRAVLKSAYAQFVFSLAGADAQQMERMRAQITAMSTGWDVATVHDIVRETLHEIVDPLVYAEAADLIEEHRAAGREIVIVSSSGAEMVGPIGEMLGVDRVVATRMVVVDGRYTGEIEFYAYGENKADGHARRSPPRAATTWPTATPTATRSPTCRCWRRSGTPPRSTPTGGCARRRSSAAGRCCSSPARSACGPASPLRRPRWSPARPSAWARPWSGWPGTPGAARCGPACSLAVDRPGPLAGRRRRRGA